MPWSRPILFFDGHCGLCSRSVRFAIRRDKGRMAYCPLQDPLADMLLKPCGVDPSRLDSAVFWMPPAAGSQVGRVWQRSSAVLRLCRHLSGIWPVLGRLGVCCPRRLRDWFYDAVAARRRSDVCALPLDIAVQQRLVTFSSLEGDLPLCEDLSES